MDTDLVVISLFGLQCLVNIITLIWGVYRLTCLEELIRKNKHDIDNVATIMRKNHVVMEGRLTRFTCEIATKFRNLNQDSNFTYPDRDNP